MNSNEIHFHAPGLKRFKTSEYAEQDARRFVSVSVTGTALLMLAAATVDAVTNDAVIGSGLPWDAPRWWAWATLGTSTVLLIPSVGVVVVGTLVRVARARTPERQQLMWLVCVVGVMIAALLPLIENAEAEVDFLEVHEIFWIE